MLKITESKFECNNQVLRYLYFGYGLKMDKSGACKVIKINKIYHENFIIKSNKYK